MDEPVPERRANESVNAPPGGAPSGKRSGPPWILLLLVVVLAAGVGWKALQRRKHERALAAAVVTVEMAVRSKPAPKRADQIVAACHRATCDCVVTAAKIGLDADLGKGVLPMIDLATDCAREKSMPGLRAEALASAMDPSAEKGARDVLAKDPKNPNARYALALLAYRAGNISDALIGAHDALEDGRGAPASLLAGLVAFELGNLNFAEAMFMQALQAEPDNLSGAYNLALVDQRMNRYAPAREGYLKVLHADPANKDARYNLAILAHSIGADDEAKHDLEKLRALAPTDPLVEKLKAALSTPVRDAPPAAPSLGVTTTVGASAAAAVPSPVPSTAPSGAKKTTP